MGFAVEPCRRIIGLGCRAGVGRSLLASALRARFGFEAVAVADIASTEGDVVALVADAESFAALRAAGALTVRIDRPGFDEVCPIDDESWDVIVDNDGSAVQLAGVAPVLVDLADDVGRGGELWVGSRVRFSAAAEEVAS